jgi:hypothetical protein
MKMTGVAVYGVTLPLEKPYRLSGGRLLFEALDATFIRLDTDSGLTGWGEGTPWGHSYLPAFGGGIRAAAAILAPAVIGLDPRRIGHVERAMDIALPGHLYAKAPFDIACWDLAGQSAGMPIADLLGGRYDEPTPIASSVPTGSPDDMLDGIAAYRARGYWVHSAKLGDGVDADIARIRHLEANRLPDETIIYDVNRAWTRDQAVTVMNAVADLPGLVFEQPCETLDDCRAVRRLTRAPIFDRRAAGDGPRHAAHHRRGHRRDRQHQDRPRRRPDQGAAPARPGGREFHACFGHGDRRLGHRRYGRRPPRPVDPAGKPDRDLGVPGNADDRPRAARPRRTQCRRDRGGARLARPRRRTDGGPPRRPDCGLWRDPVKIAAVRLYAVPLTSRQTYYMSDSGVLGAPVATFG